MAAEQSCSDGCLDAWLGQAPEQCGIVVRWLVAQVARLQLVGPEAANRLALMLGGCISAH